MTIIVKRSCNPKFLFFTIFLIVVQINILTGQDKNNRLFESYKQAVELFHTGAFEASHILMQEVTREAALTSNPLLINSEGYLTLIAIESRDPALIAKYNRYETLYPQSSMLTSIRFSYASYLFDNEEYSEAIKIYNKINPKRIERVSQNQYFFKKGYSYLKTGELSKAEVELGKVSQINYDSYSAPAKYFLAHTHYLKKEFKRAIELFSEISAEPRFSLLSRYYILESRFMLGDHSYVTKYGEELYQELLGEYKEKSARLVSESFFALGENQKARYYFERYALSRNMLSRNEIYYAAMLAFKQSKYEEAIELFKQVATQEDTLTQNSAYHLGKCYIETKNKLEALNSFQRASRLMGDPIIKEDATFNYAKLSFDLNTDITPFKSYLESYSPTEKKFNEIQSYIANSYLINQDYRSAIEALKTIKNPSANEIVNLQKATFLRGMELLSLGAYRDAIMVFELSLANGQYNNNLSNITKLWLAEAYYRDNQLNKSIEINLELTTKNPNFASTPEFATALYNLAYSYFKMANYSKAEASFKRYLNLSRADVLYFDEASARLGDCYFMQRKYSEALTAYSSLSGSNRGLREYSNFQKAIVQGLLGNDREKSILLKEMISKGVSSNLHQEALYELSRTLIQIGEDESAINYLTELCTKFSNTTYYPKALLELGLIYLNKGEGNKAIDYYKKIIEENSKSPEVQSAIAGLENIYRDQGRGEEFLSYIDNLGLSQTRTASERELIIFSSAESQFLSGEYPAAVHSLTSFLKSYPDGPKSAQGWFYLGEAYSKLSKPESALDAFLKVMEIGEGSFTELATLNYARISYSLENYRQAIKAYSSLTRVARLQNNIIEAALGLMNSLFKDKQYKAAITEANRALTLEISQSNKINCEYIIAKSHYLLGEREAALKYLKELSTSKITPEGAESTYLIISDAFDKGDFAKVEKEVYAFADSRTPHNYWLAKSYILLGDTFAEKENWEQAEATYNSILTSYKSDKKDDIEEQIRMRLSKIEEIKKSKHENK